ncbi:MAG: hypothetical protein ACKVU1_08450 [bacterium]
MRFPITNAALFAIAVCTLAGCGLAGSRPPALLAPAEIAARLPADRVTSLEGEGRLSVRGPDGSSDLSFAIQYLEGEGLRLDFTWKSFIGLVRREGTILVRGDSVWLRLPDEELQDPYWRSTAARRDVLLGLAPADFVILMISGAEEVRSRAPEIVTVRAEDSGERWRIGLATADRSEEVLVDAKTGDLLSRELSLVSTSRTTRVTYSRHRQAGVLRRPFSIELHDSAGPIRGKIAFARQVCGARIPASRFQPADGSRLLVGLGDVGPSRAESGTLIPARGGPES